MQKRLLALGTLAALASAFSLQAQCAEASFGTAVGTGDDIVLGVQALGFAFPFNGTTFTDIHISTNGFVYLSNGGVPAPGGALCCTGTTAQLVAGSPKICAYWSDLNIIAANGSAVKYNALPGKAVITWENAVEFGNTERFTVQMQLSVTGEITFTYDSRCQIRTTGDFLVGMSEGGGVAVPAVSDFATVNTSTTATVWENWTTLGSFDLAGQSVLFVPTGVGYTWVPTPCPSGTNVAYGTGCYSAPGTGVYEFHTDAAVASAALQGNAMTMIPTGFGYTGLWLAGGATAFIAPTGAATSLTATDDGILTGIALPAPMPTPNGPVTTISIASNAVIGLGTTANNGGDFTPTGAEFSNAAGACFYAWHDYNPGEVGSGAIKTEQVGNVFCVTWDGVENYSTPLGPNPGTMQFQLDLTTGAVTMLWTVVDANITSTFGSPHLVGWKAGGAITDPGSQVLATALPLTTASQLLPMTLAASPSPVSTPTTGSTVVYTTGAMPEFAPGAGIYVGINILSLTQIPAPGVDLVIIGAPGCPALIGTLDVVLNLVGVTPTNTSALPLPAGLPSGIQIFAQSAALIVPNSLPNGQNAFGLTTSNGIASTIGSW
ncbi:MAG: hypothetical protein ACK5UQ_11750 [Planctomycetota bacterium]|jgi:hypothetical protein